MSDPSIRSFSPEVADRARSLLRTAAWGRDYADVPPVKGVIFTDATTSTLEVSVDVAPIGT